MNAAWAYAARITDAFAKYGWMARTRGVEGGGKVEGLPVHTFPTDDGDVAMKCPTEIAITDRREFELSNLGFLPLLHSKGTDFAVFMGAQSCQKPKTYFDPAANANAELSAKFNLIMCTSRFAHYLKVMARDKIGSFMEAGECEQWLNGWIKNYVRRTRTGVGRDEGAVPARATPRSRSGTSPGKPGWYEAVAYLRPHFQLETLTTSMRLVAEVPKKGCTAARLGGSAKKPPGSPGRLERGGPGAERNEVLRGVPSETGCPRSLLPRRGRAGDAPVESRRARWETLACLRTISSSSVPSSRAYRVPSCRPSPWAAT